MWPSGQASDSAQTKCARGSAPSIAASSVSTRRMAMRKSLSGPAQRAETTPGAPPSAGTTSPKSSASAGNRAPRAAASAFSSALATKVSPVSSGSGRPSSADRDDGDGERPQQFADLAHLAGIVAGKDQPVAGEPSRHPPAVRQASPSARRCKVDQLDDAAAGERHHLQQLRLAERLLLGGALHLDDGAGAGEHEVGVGVGARILLVVEVEHADAVADAAGDGGDLIGQRHRLQQAEIDQSTAGEMKARRSRR